MEPNRPPVLKKVTPPTSEDSIQLLRSIDSSLEIVAQLSREGINLPEGKKSPFKKDPLEEIQKSLVEFQKSISNSLDVSSLSKEDARSYIETRKKQAEQERESIVGTIEELKTSLFSKKSMTNEDVATLNELNKIYDTLKTQEDSSKNRDYEENEKRSWWSEKLGALSDNIGSHFKTGFMALSTGITAGLMGPLNLIAKPLEGLFGFQFADIFESFVFPDRDKKKELNKKFIKPNRSDMMKYNPEAVYLADMIAGPEKGETDTDSIIDKLFGGKAGSMAGKVLPFLAKAIPIAAIVGSLVWAVFDGIKASKLADEWGVTSTEAFIGGFLAGNGSGWKNAFKNAGKWALMGAGVGFLAAGPVGAIAGGLIGGAIGGILGYFGGEKVSKGVAKVWDWLQETLDIKKIIELSPIGAVLKFVDKMKETWKNPDKTIGEKLKDTTKGIFVMFKDIIFAPFNFMTELFKGNIIKKHIPLKDLGKQLGEWVSGGISTLLQKLKLEGTPVGNFMSQMGNWVMGLVTNYLGGIEDTFTDFSSLLKGDMSIKDFALNLVKRIFGGIGDAVKDFFMKNPIGKHLKISILTPITEFFAGIGDFFEYLKQFDVLSLAKAVVSGDFTKGLTTYKAGQAESRKEQRRSEVIESYKVELGKDYTNYKAMEKSNAPGTREQKDKLIDKLLAKGLVNKTEVNDAIIHPSGQIIVPHKDDTIIASKNPVESFKKSGSPLYNNNVYNNQKEINYINNESSKQQKPFLGIDPVLQDLLSEKLEDKDSFNDSKLLKALERIVEAIEEKPFNNIMTNVEQKKETNFNDLRFAF